MNQLIPLFLLFISCSFIACNKSERIEAEKLQEIAQFLPGKWKIATISIKGDGSYHTIQAGIFEDTILEDYGTISYSDFYDDVSISGFDALAADIIYEKDGNELDSRISQLNYIEDPDEVWVYYRSNEQNEDWNTDFGEFIKNIFLLDGNYVLNIIDENTIEILGTTRSIERVLLERL